VGVRDDSHLAVRGLLGTVLVILWRGEAVVLADNRECRQASLLELLANIERVTGQNVPPGHPLARRVHRRFGRVPDLLAGVAEQAVVLVEPFDESVEALAQQPPG